MVEPLDFDRIAEKAKEIRQEAQNWEYLVRSYRFQVFVRQAAQREDQSDFEQIKIFVNSRNSEKMRELMRAGNPSFEMLRRKAMSYSIPHCEHMCKIELVQAIFQHEERTRIQKEASELERLAELDKQKRERAALPTAKAS